MAEIKIEKKRKPFWPWLLGLLLLVLLAWGAYEVFDTDPQEVATVTDTRDFTEQPRETEPRQPERQPRQPDAEAGLTGAVGDYVKFANDTAAEMGLDHEYTSEGLNKLADAIDELASNAGIENDQLDANLEEMKSKAEFIQKDPQSLRHADSLNVAFNSAADAMEKIQQQEFPQQNQEIEQLRQQAQEISKNQQTLNQKQEVREFFDQSAETLERFAQNTTEEQEG